MGRDEIARRKAKRQGTSRTMRAWALLVPERGKQLTFDGFPFQEEWYSEEIADAKEVVWMKSAQVGMSTFAWRWAARRAEQFSDSVIYFFPTDDDVANFGDQRIEPSILESPMLTKAIPDDSIRHKHLKRIGSGWLALKGTQSRKSVQSVDADALVFDEYDYCHQGNIAQAERRIAGAIAAGRQPRIRRLGYPTIAGRGIHAIYERSDKRIWHVTCPSCGEEQPVHFQANMRWQTEPDGDIRRWGHDSFVAVTDVHTAWRACRECEASLEALPGERGPIHDGRWIATAESKLIGYHASRLIAPITDLNEIVISSRKTSAEEQEAFWNNDLGLPFSPAESALTDDDIDAACSLGGAELSRASPRRFYLAGLDVASSRALSLWVAEIRPDGLQTVHLSEPETFEDALEVLRRFRINLCVVDHMPERRMARALAAALPGRVVLGRYDGKNESDAFNLDTKKNIVTINRTEGIDAFQDLIRRTALRPLQKPPARFKPQLLAPKRRTVINSAGKAHREYVSTGNEGDDFSHAGVYLVVAWELWRLRVGVQTKVAANKDRPMPRDRPGKAIDDYRPGFGGDI